MNQSSSTRSTRGEGHASCMNYVLGIHVAGANHRLHFMQGYLSIFFLAYRPNVGIPPTHPALSECKLSQFHLIPLTIRTSQLYHSIQSLNSFSFSPTQIGTWNWYFPTPTLALLKHSVGHKSNKSDFVPWVKLTDLMFSIRRPYHIFFLL